MKEMTHFGNHNVTAMPVPYSKYIGSHTVPLIVL